MQCLPRKFSISRGSIFDLLNASNDALTSWMSGGSPEPQRVWLYVPNERYALYSWCEDGSFKSMGYKNPVAMRHACRQTKSMFSVVGPGSDERGVANLAECQKSSNSRLSSVETRKRVVPFTLYLLEKQRC